MKRIRTWLVLGTPVLIILISAGMAGGWALTDTVIEATSDRAFCTVCHSMEPFAQAYDQDSHGGRNPGGVAAACVDCHLPHTGPVRYLAAKVHTGLHDGWAQVLSLFKEPDWVGNLDRRADYVYDSGCLRCHARLRDATSDDPTAAFAHQTYFQQGSNMHCVTCHAHVGHKDLLSVLTTDAEAALAAPAEAQQAGR
jgi:cytochrome c-type protein NapC